MCGRFALFAEPATVAAAFQLAEIPLWEARYNLAPTQPVLVIRVDPLHGVRAASLLRWGLIPSWADDPSIGSRMINARAETVNEKPSFRAAFRRRRCLIPASGLYEWRTEYGKKQPFFIHPAGGGLFAFAGLWETWTRGGGCVESCTILTTSANETLRPYHERMPVILSPDTHALWLDAEQSAEVLLPLLRPSSEPIDVYPVSPRVNNVRHEGAECAARIAELFPA